MLLLLKREKRVNWMRRWRSQRIWSDGTRTVHGGHALGHGEDGDRGLSARGDEPSKTALFSLCGYGRIISHKVTCDCEIHLSVFLQKIDKGKNWV